MTTLVHEILGNKRVRKICDNAGLTPKDAEIVDQILIEWEKLIGRLDEKMKVLMKKTQYNPRGKEIEQAIFIISAEFLKKRIREKDKV